MSKYFTPCMMEDAMSDKQEHLCEVESYTYPRKETLDFLKQFARVYRVEHKLDKELSAVILN